MLIQHMAGRSYIRKGHMSTGMPSSEKGRHEHPTYIEKEKRVEIRNTKEEERLNEEITSLKRRLKLQTEATSRSETKVSEKDSEIKKLHEDRAKLDNDLAI